MKKLLSILLISLSFSSFAQCVKCNSIDEALKEPLKVKSLIVNSIMHKIRLDSVPVSIQQLVHLEILFLTDQNISTIPVQLSSLTQLKELSFAGCHLTEVPDFIFELKNLKELILFSNDFSSEYLIQLKKICKEKLPKTKLMIDED